MQFIEGLGLYGAWADNHGNLILLQKGETADSSQIRAFEKLNSLIRCTNTIDCECCENCHEAIGLKNANNRCYVYKSLGRRLKYNSWLEFLAESDWYVIVYPAKLYHLMPPVKDEKTAKQTMLISYLSSLSDRPEAGFHRGKLNGS